jgi:hypothetical protein
VAYSNPKVRQGRAIRAEEQRNPSSIEVAKEYAKIVISPSAMEVNVSFPCKAFQIYQIHLRLLFNSTRPGFTAKVIL